MTNSEISTSDIAALAITATLFSGVSSYITWEVRKRVGLNPAILALTSMCLSGAGTALIWYIRTKVA